MQRETNQNTSVKIHIGNSNLQEQIFIKTLFCERIYNTITLYS